MSVINKDFIKEIGQTVLEDNEKEAIKNVVNQCINCEMKGNYSNFDFDELLQSVVTQTIKSVFGEAIDAKIANQIIGYISGKSSVFSFNLEKYGIYGSEICDAIENVYNFSTKISSLKSKCDRLTTNDEDYYNSVKKIGDDFLDLAESLSNAVPVVGYYITNMITTVSDAYDKQYSYIMSNKEYTCTQMAIMALKYNVEAAEIFLLTQDNLVLDNQELLLLGLSGKTGTFMDMKGILKMFEFDDIDKMLDYYDSDLDLINTPDEIREFCVKSLKAKGYKFGDKSIDEIREMLKNDFKNNNIGSGSVSGSSVASNFNSNVSARRSYIPDSSKPIDPNNSSNQNNSNNSNNSSSSNNSNNSSNWNSNSDAGNIQDSAEDADEKTKNDPRAKYDPLVIDLGKTGFELTGMENGVHFDMDLNGFAEKTDWIAGDDAFLALDLNGDGKINNSGELFGDRTLLSA